MVTLTQLILDIARVGGALRIQPVSEEILQIQITDKGSLAPRGTGFVHVQDLVEAAIPDLVLERRIRDLWNGMQIIDRASLENPLDDHFN